MIKRKRKERGRGVASHFKYNRKPIYFVQVECLRKKCLLFGFLNVSKKKRWPKNKRMLLQANTEAEEEEEGPDSQPNMQPCIRNDNSFGFVDGNKKSKNK